MALDTTKSKEAFNSFSTVKKVPQTPLYTSIDLLDGKSEGEELGHFQKSASGKEINFMIIHKPAIIKWISTSHLMRYHQQTTQIATLTLSNIASMESLTLTTTSLQASICITSIGRDDYGADGRHGGDQKADPRKKESSG